MINTLTHTHQHITYNPSHTLRPVSISITLMASVVKMITLLHGLILSCHTCEQIRSNIILVYSNFYSNNKFHPEMLPSGRQEVKIQLLTNQQQIYIYIYILLPYQ